MEILQNTLYVLTQGAYLHRENLTLKVDVERRTRMSVPIHRVDSVAVFGSVMVSPGAMELCAQAGAPLTFLSETGRLVARVDAPQSGGVVLRRRQYRAADDAALSHRWARGIVSGKLHNARALLLRAARQSQDADEVAELTEAAKALAGVLGRLTAAPDVDSVRGHEGEGARAYFACFDRMVRQQRQAFKFEGRNRRPPLDPMNSLLSFP